MVGRLWQPHVRPQSTAFVTTKVTRSSEWQVFTTEWLAKTAKPIGRRSAFCHNPAAMNPHWAIYKKEMRHYLRHFALAPLVALIPYLLNLAHWRQHGGLLRGLLYTLLAGTVIGLVIGFFFGGVYAVLTWIKIRTGKFYQPTVIVHILLGCFSAVTGIWLVSFFPGLRYAPSQAQPSFFSILIFSGLIATGFTLYFAYRRAQEESLALRAVAAEARYHTLENQMRPHFLFNALNSLAELIESRQENAAETAYKLAELYRQILANSGLKTASLSSELEIVRAYLELEQLRFGARLQFSVQALAEAEQIYLPSLMLQTLVENAVKHGIAPSVTGGKVEIQIVNTQSASPSVSQPGSHSVSQSAFQPASQLVSQSAPTPRLFFLRVTNTGRRYQTQVTAQGVGLANTRARLELLYPGRHQFTIGSDDSGQTVASFYFTGERID